MKTFNLIKSTGTGDISPRLLKTDKPNNKISGHQNIQQIASEKVPDKWKLANVTPIYIIGDRIYASNYLSTSLSSVLGNILKNNTKGKKFITFRILNRLSAWIP